MMSRPRRVLVVDDDPDVVLYLSSLLEDHGYEVETAAGTLAALESLAGFRPDAVLIDVLMPGRSGLELLIAVRTDTLWCELPVILVTGCDEILEDDCRSYLDSHDGVRGPDRILGKPIEPVALLDAIRSLVHGPNGRGDGSHPGRSQ